MLFKSKKQWRWAYATGKPWAKRWAHKTRSYKGLPSSRGTGGRGRRRGPRKHRR